MLVSKKINSNSLSIKIKNLINMNITKHFCIGFLCLLNVVANAQTFQIDTFLQHQMKEYHIPAVSAAIIDNGKIVITKVYGKANVEYNIPCTKGTAFQLASVTKLISATAVMMLVQEGKLELNKNVRYYLPQLPDTWEDMKVIDLLAHQSGIVDLLAFQYNFSSLKNALDTATARPLDFAPGTKTVYAGGDYAVVMMFPSWTYAAGGLFSSVEDLSKWAVALDNNTVLQPGIEEEMWNAAKLRDGKDSPFGVGWIVAEYNGEKATGHSGGPALADIVRLPNRKITVIVLTNQLELRPFLTMKVLDLYMKYKK